MLNGFSLCSEFIILSSRGRGSNYKIRRIEINPMKRVPDSDGAQRKESQIIRGGLGEAANAGGRQEA